LRVGADGRFAFGFGRDHAAEAELEIALHDGARETRLLAVARRSYDIQRIEGLPPRMVEPSEADMARIKADNAAIAAARGLDTPQAWWDTQWIWPVIGRISGVYGSQRILNGQPRRPHSASTRRCRPARPWRRRRRASSASPRRTRYPPAAP
jgi:hypothetical protein